MSGDLHFFKLDSVNLAGQDLTPIVIPVIRETGSESPLKISFAKWFDHLFSYSYQGKSLTPLQLSHDTKNDRWSVKLIHKPEKPTDKPEKPTDFLLAFVNDNDNTLLDAELITNDFSEKSPLGSYFSHAVEDAKLYIEAHHYHITLKKRESCVIGRNLDCEIRLKDPCVSRNHARIEVEPDGNITILDLGSRNGTFVDGMRISGKTRINEGDSVRLGDTTLKFSVKKND